MGEGHLLVKVGACANIIDFLARVKYEVSTPGRHCWLVNLAELTEKHLHMCNLLLQTLPPCQCSSVVTLTL
jgi:hypothetical protein